MPALPAPWDKPLQECWPACGMASKQVCPSVSAGASSRSHIGNGSLQSAFGGPVETGEGREGNEVVYNKLSCTEKRPQSIL